GGADLGGGETFGCGHQHPVLRLAVIVSLPIHHRPDPLHLRTPTGYRRAPPPVQVLLGSHPDAFLCLLPGGQSGAVRSARLHAGASSPDLASAPGTQSRRLGIHPATALAQPGSGGGLLSPAVLFTDTRGIRSHPVGYHRSSPWQTARKTEAHRAGAVFFVRKRAVSIVPDARRHSSRDSTSPPIPSVEQDHISPSRCISWL